MQCAECEHPLRPQMSKAADWPETRDVAAKGLCRPCYRAAQDGERAVEYEVVFARQALAGFLVERRTRLLRKHGGQSVPYGAKGSTMRNTESPASALTDRGTATKMEV
jgi:hypothetical protein